MHNYDHHLTDNKAEICEHSNSPQSPRAAKCWRLYFIHLGCILQSKCCLCLFLTYNVDNFENIVICVNYF